jgi:hypothetical protein
LNFTNEPLDVDPHLYFRGFGRGEEVLEVYTPWVRNNSAISPLLKCFLESRSSSSPLTTAVFSLAPCHSPIRVLLRFHRYPKPLPALGTQCGSCRSAMRRNPISPAAVRTVSASFPVLVKVPTPIMGSWKLLISQLFAEFVLQILLFTLGSAIQLPLGSPFVFSSLQGMLRLIKGSTSPYGEEKKGSSRFVAALVQ